jgi:hypothetical protein
MDCGIGTFLHPTIFQKREKDGRPLSSFFGLNARGWGTRLSVRHSVNGITQVRPKEGRTLIG